MIGNKEIQALCAVTISLAGSCAVADAPENISADVVFLSEQHDNPGHHAVQAEWTRVLQPSALVFEMLTPDQAAAVSTDNRKSQDDLALALEWDDKGWPDFAMYYPIFAAAPDAQVYGAGVPREQIRDLMAQPLEQAFGVEETRRFGLDQPLAQDQQQKREALQREAHCNALPDDLLPMMVSVQRLRDATLARAALEALVQTGGPVVVITGNGHARTDWGAPFLLRMANPDVSLFSLGQGEGGSDPAGVFDATVDGPTVDRGDPCDAFQ